jgi:hypothetical protein
MPEYIGIVKKGPEFDWGTVIEGVQKSLIDSEAARQASRDKLEKDTNDSITAMSKITLGKDEDLNVKLTEAAYNSKQALGAYAKSVREGRASQKDFNIFNNNLKGTFDTFDAVGKNAKVAYDTYIAENNAGNLSAASDYMAQKFGLAASLKGKSLTIDPKTGRGFIAGEDPNDLVEVNWLNNQRNLLIPKVKMDAELDTQADKIKDYIKYGKVGAGGVWVINDPTKRKEFEIYENNVVNGITSDKLKAMSVLVDYGGSDKDGKRYSVTINEDEAKKDPRKIFVKLNSSGTPEPVFTPEQEQEAKDTAKRYFRQRVVLEEKQVENTYRPPVFAPKEEKPASVVATLNDFKYTSSTIDENTGKRTARSGFTLNIPVIDKSTGAAQNLKAVYIDPEKKEFSMKVEEKNVVNGVTTVSDVTYSNIRKGDVPPDISKLSSLAAGIYDTRKGRYLESYKEVEDWLKPQAMANWRTIQKGGGAQTTASGIKYTVE